MNHRSQARDAILHFLARRDGGDYASFMAMWPDEGFDEFVDFIGDDVEDIVEQAPGPDRGPQDQWYRDFVGRDLPALRMFIMMLSDRAAGISSDALTEIAVMMRRSFSRMPPSQVEFEVRRSLSRLGYGESG